jgi:hypothetical protein
LKKKMADSIVKSAHLLRISVLAFLLAASGLASQHAPQPSFKYVGGTTALPEKCRGKLELNSQDMVFDCSEGSMSIPYTSIRYMEYRASISRKVRRMKPHWKVKPGTISPLFGGKRNRYFTIVYKDQEDGPTNALVLEVSPDAMRPYLAEIDLKVGQRVEVESFEDYD